MSGKRRTKPAAPMVRRRQLGTTPALDDRSTGRGAARKVAKSAGIGRGMESLIGRYPVGNPPPPVANVAALELAWAQRDSALIALQGLEVILSRVGGFMTPEDQATLREGRAVLAEHGRLKTDERVEWVDRPAPVVVQK